MCLFQFRQLSIYTPKYLQCSLCFNSFPSSFTCKSRVLATEYLDPTSIASDFLWLLMRPLWRNQTLTWLKSPFWRAGMAQWWERSPPTNVSQVRFPDLASYVGWVCCWFSSLLREVFLRVWFYPLLKNQHFQIPILAWKVPPISVLNTLTLTDVLTKIFHSIDFFKLLPRTDNDLLVSEMS